MKDPLIAVAELVEEAQILSNAVGDSELIVTILTPIGEKALEEMTVDEFAVAHSIITT